MKHRKCKIFLASAIFIAMVFTTGCGLLPMKQENRVAPIAQTVEQQQYVYIDVAQGSVVDTETVVLSANFGESNYLRFNRSSSVVENVFFKVGDTVKEGDLLIEAETSNYLSQISQYESDIAEYTANIEYYSGLIELEKERQRIYNANGMEFDDSLLKDYQRNLDYNNDAIDVAYRQLHQTEEDYENARIYAPYDGTITYIAEVGSTLYEQQTAVNLIRENVYYYATTDKEEFFEVGETYEAEYRYYKYVLVTDSNENNSDLNAQNGLYINEQYETELVTDYVDLECKEINLLNEDTGVYEILFGYNSILNDLDILTTRIIFVVGSVDNVMYVPKNTVIATSDGFAVYMLAEDGSRTIRDVEVGLQGDDYYEIKSGLSLGDQVISDRARANEDMLY